MTFKNCVACGAQRIVWDLDKQGRCEGGCIARSRISGEANATVSAGVPSRTYAREAALSALQTGLGIAQQKTEAFADSLVDVIHKHGFDKPEDGSENRYDERRERQPAARHTFWWLLHNCVAHPLIGIVPKRFAFEFHDWTSRKLHGR